MMRQLMGFVVCFYGAMDSFSVAADVVQIQTKLDAARTTYEAKREQFHEYVAKYFDKRNEAARRSGNKKQVDQIKEEQKAFEVKGDLPSDAPAELRRKISTARQAMESAYQTAIRDFTKSMFDDEAASTEKLLEQFKRDRDAEWVEMFNGNDLKGWTPSEGSKANWNIVRGVLVGIGEGNLVSDRKDYGNFRLKVEGMLPAGADSGIFFRVQDHGIGFAYEAQIGGTVSGRVNTGSLIYFKHPKTVEMAIAPTAVPSGRWFIMELLAEGNKFTTWIDGKQVAQCDDKNQNYPLGAIAIQTFRGASSGGINVRKIAIKELPAK